MRVLLLTHNAANAGLGDWIASRASEFATSDARIDVATARRHDLVVSYGYRHIIAPDVLAVARHVNLHIAYLPFNRGADPNVWSHLERTPAGVTIHEIDAGIDTGPIIAQKRVDFGDDVTLRESYDALSADIQALFRQHWGAIHEGVPASKAQEGPGTFHRAKDFAAIRDRLLGSEGWDVPIWVLRQRWDELRRASP